MLYLYCWEINAILRVNRLIQHKQLHLLKREDINIIQHQHQQDRTLMKFFKRDFKRQFNFFKTKRKVSNDNTFFKSFPMIIYFKKVFNNNTLLVTFSDN